MLLKEGVDYKKIGHPRYKYKLIRDYIATVGYGVIEPITTPFIIISPLTDTTSKMYIETGYAWDGCSGPTIDGPTNMRAGLHHDPPYQLIREGHLSRFLYKHQADSEFLRVLIEDGDEYAKTFNKWLRPFMKAAGRVQATAYHQAVVFFGGSSCDSRS